MTQDTQEQRLHRAAPESSAGPGGLTRTRYRVCAAGILVLVGAVWALAAGHLTRTLLAPGLGEVLPIGYLNILHGAKIALSLALVWACRSTRFTAEQILRAGLVYEVVICFAISLSEHLRTQQAEMYAGVSPLCVALVLFATMIPATWKQRVTATAASVCMWPLALGFAISVAGVPMPGTARTAQVLVWILACAVLGLMASRVMLGYSTAVARARQQLQELGSYRLLERLGEGGMGEVWRAEHNLLHRPAAVKVIKPKVLQSKDPADVERTMARFEREARATSKLNSLHTIDLYDFGTTDDGAFYYVMQLLDGMDLESIVRRHGPLPAERVVHLLAQACDSLGEAHAAGMVHRDLKPANFFVCRLGQTYDVLKLLDFGLVLSVSAEGQRIESRLTMQGHVSGTPAYMAPESGFENRGVDGRTDIYAVGCVAYYLLTGLLVFQADTGVAMILAHMRDTPEPPSSRTSAEIPADLEAVIMKCLEKQPDDRPHTAEELLELLRGCAVFGAWTPERARSWWEHVEV